MVRDVSANNATLKQREARREVESVSVTRNKEADPVRALPRVLHVVRGSGVTEEQIKTLLVRLNVSGLITQVEIKVTPTTQAVCHF